MHGGGGERLDQPSYQCENTLSTLASYLPLVNLFICIINPAQATSMTLCIGRTAHERIILPRDTYKSTNTQATGPGIVIQFPVAHDKPGGRLFLTLLYIQLILLLGRGPEVNNMRFGDPVLAVTPDAFGFTAIQVNLKDSRDGSERRETRYNKQQQVWRH